jgi:hypothetical protein
MGTRTRVVAAGGFPFSVKQQQQHRQINQRTLAMSRSTQVDATLFDDDMKELLGSSLAVTTDVCFLWHACLARHTSNPLAF